MIKNHAKLYGAVSFKSQFTILEAKLMGILSYHPGIIFYPCCVIEYAEDKLEVISVSGSPFLPQELCGVLLLQRKSCSGCLGIPGRAGHRDCHNFQPRQQMCPAALGWRCIGHSQPLSPLPDPQYLCTHRKAKSQTGLPVMP